MSTNMFMNILQRLTVVKMFEQRYKVTVDQVQIICYRK